MVLRLAHVRVGAGESRQRRYVGKHNHVVGVRPVVVERTEDAAAEQSEVQSDVPLGGLLPALVRVSHRQLVGHVVRLVGAVAQHVGQSVEGQVEARDVANRGVGSHGGVARHAHAEAQLQVAHPLGIVLDEALLADAPGQGCRGEEVPLVAFGQLRRTVPAAAHRQHVALVEAVVQPDHVRLQLALRQSRAQTYLLVSIAHVHRVEGVPQVRVLLQHLGAHVRRLRVPLRGRLQQRNAHLVHIGKRAVVHQHVVKRPREVAPVVQRRLVDALVAVRVYLVSRESVNIHALAEVAEVGAECNLIAQTLDRLQNLAQVNRGREVTQCAECLRLLLRVVPLVNDVVRAVLAARIDDAVAVGVVGDGPVVNLLGGAVDGVGHRPRAAAGRRHAVVALSPGTVDAGLHREPLRRLDAHTHLARIAVVPLALLRALVAQVSERAVGVQLVSTAAHSQRVLVRERRLRHILRPVLVRNARGVPVAALPALHDVSHRCRVERAILLRKQRLVLSLRRVKRVGIFSRIQVVGSPAGKRHEVAGTHRGRTVYNVRYRQRARIVNRHAPALALLRRHQHHAVGAAATVDGRCRGILQNVNRLNVARVQRLNARGRHQGNAVHHVQRVVAAVQRALTANPDAADRARTLARRNVNTGSLALQSLQRVRHRPDVQLLLAHARQGASHVALLLNAVTHHDHLVEQLLVLFEGHVNLAFACHRNVLCTVAHV